MIEIRITVVLLMFVISSYLDIRSREVNEKYWLFFASVGLILYGYEWIFDEIFIDLYQAVFSLAITVLFGFAFYYFGFYGGADFFALISLTVLLPIYFPPNYFHPITSLIVITNATFLVLGLPIYFFVRNLLFLVRRENIFSGFEEESKWKKLIVLFLGYRMHEVEKKDFYIALEKKVEGKKRFSISLLSEEDDFLAGKDIWGTPGLPMLVFLTLGFLIMILLGDLVSIIIRILV